MLQAGIRIAALNATRTRDMMRIMDTPPFPFAQGSRPGKLYAVPFGGGKSGNAGKAENRGARNAPRYENEK